jgi:hypothetical protein
LAVITHPGAFTPPLAAHEAIPGATTEGAVEQLLAVGFVAQRRHPRRGAPHAQSAAIDGGQHDCVDAAEQLHPTIVPDAPLRAHTLAPTMTDSARLTVERTANLDSGRPARLGVRVRAWLARATHARRPRRRREGAPFLVL